MKTVKTSKGTELPLIALKGKDYLMVGHRIQWFNEEVERFNINTEFLLLTDEQTVARATVSIFSKEGVLLKSATATKRETMRDFPDHTEKAETSSIGRAVALLGFGTQFALSDLEEGNRLADSPLQSVTKPSKSTASLTALKEVVSAELPVSTSPSALESKTSESEAPKARTTFRKSAPATTEKTATIPVVKTSSSLNF